MMTPQILQLLIMIVQSDVNSLATVMAIITIEKLAATGSDIAKEK
jgi:hypothetical protein